MCYRRVARGAGRDALDQDWRDAAPVECPSHPLLELLLCESAQNCVERLRRGPRLRRVFIQPRRRLDYAIGPLSSPCDTVRAAP